jgi:hypothetical protein
MVYNCLVYQRNITRFNEKRNFEKNSERFFFFMYLNCSSAVRFRATKILKIFLPVWFNHLIPAAHIFSQKFFPEPYQAQKLFCRIFVQGIFPVRPRSAIPEQGPPSGSFCPFFPLMVRGNFTAFPDFLRTFACKLSQSEDF